MLTTRKLYQIYTESKNFEDIQKIVGKEFDGFSIIPARGWWKGVEENALVIEIIGGLPTAASVDNLRYEKEKVRRVAGLIKEHNEQESVLLTVSTVNYEEV